MPAIVTSTEVERPAAEVFAYATDPTRFREWQKGVVDGHMDGHGGQAGSPAVGSKCVTTRRIGGASRPSTAELVHFDPPRTWRVEGINGPIRAEPAAEVEVNGFSIIEAADVAAAKQILSSHPFIGRGGTLQVSEFIGA